MPLPPSAPRVQNSDNRLAIQYPNRSQVHHLPTTLPLTTNQTGSGTGLGTWTSHYQPRRYSSHSQPRRYSSTSTPTLRGMHPASNADEQPSRGTSQGPSILIEEWVVVQKRIRPSSYENNLKIHKNTAHETRPKNKNVKDEIMTTVYPWTSNRFSALTTSPQLESDTPFKKTRIFKLSGRGFSSWRRRCRRRR
jgi:hypothetical protein